VAAVRDRLEAAGEDHSNGDGALTTRDPWGNAVVFTSRAG
jgi:hypothetical protein